MIIFNLFFFYMSCRSCLRQYPLFLFYGEFCFVLIKKRYWILLNVLSASWKWSCAISLLLCKYLVNIWIDFLILDHFCIPELNPAWTWDILLVDCWVLFSIVFKIFMLLPVSEISLYFPPMCVYAVLYFWNQHYASLLKRFRKSLRL